MEAHDKSARPLIEVMPDTHERLQRLSRELHRSAGEIVTDLVDRYERELFWKQANEAVERLRADPVAWNDYLREIEFLQDGSMDGLEDDPYFTPEEEGEIRATHQSSSRA